MLARVLDLRDGFLGPVLLAAFALGLLAGSPGACSPPQVDRAAGATSARGGAIALNKHTRGASEGQEATR